MPRTVVGEGSYGCVHSPSIHCITPPNPGFDYTNYVSKLMKTTHAQQELAEFVIMKQFDPTDEYHLGEPILCEPNLTEANVKADIGKCKKIKLADVEETPDNYSLLVLPYGGPDLKTLCNNHLKTYLTTDTVKRTDEFWLEVHHLIKGLKFFKTNGVVHYDIKPQNILFDLTNKKLRYIDFGLMRTKQAIINSSKDSSNRQGIYHWSYPLECGLMNHTQFVKYTYSPRILFENKLCSLIIKKSRNNSYNLPIYNPASFQILFTYLNPNNVIPQKSTQYGYIHSFFGGFNDLLVNKSYTEILNHTTDSIDVFGLGFTLQFMANCFKRLNAVSLENYTRLSAFFYKMYDFNPVTRVIDIDLLLHEYENILLENGILTRIGKSFENNTLVHEAPPFFINLVDTNSEHLSPELEMFANNDAIICPEGKDINPTTKRCIKQCLPGYYRNDKFKCRKTKAHNRVPQRNISNSTSTQHATRCPEGKEINPTTKRCIKQCLPGYYRNDKFKCRKTKTRKNNSNNSNDSLHLYL